MSSISFRRPEFRLYLGYPEIVLTRAGRTLGTVGAEVPDLRAALARLAEAVVRARGRLVAVLPESEVWRGRLDLAGRGRAERRTSARTIAAGRLGVSADAVTVVLGARDAGGSFPVAGVRRATLLETRSLLAAVGLRPSAIVGAGAFAGFAAAPRLGGSSWRLPSLPPHRQGLAAALGAGALASLAVAALGLPSPPTSTPVVAVPAPAVAEAVASAPTSPPAAVRPQVAPAPLGLRSAERPKPRPAAVRPEPMVTVATRNLPDDLPLAEAPRRGPVPKLLELATTARALTFDVTMPAPLRRPAAKPAPEVAEIARTAMPMLPVPAATSELRPLPRPRAEAPAATSGPAADGAALAPRPRGETAQPAVLVASLDPAPVIAATLAATAAPAAKPAPAAESAALVPPPRPRGEAAQPAVLVASLDPAPVTAATLAATAAPAAKPAPAAESAALVPPPRPRGEAAQPAVLVASLDPAPVTAATLTATTAPVLASPPPARPAELQVAKAAPAKPVAKAAPAAKPAPVVVVRPKPVAPKPVAKQAAPQPVVTQVAPQRQVLVRKVAAPAPQRVATAAAVAPAPPKAAVKPVRQKVVAKPKPAPKAVKPASARPTAVAQNPVREKAATQRVGLSRGNVSLVGVFAGADGRHALLRLPNGKIERVKAGDRVQGVQIAAINADSVRVTGRGKDTLLRLPD